MTSKVFSEGYFEMGGTKKSFSEMRLEKKIADILVCHNQQCRACWDAAGLVIEIIDLYLRKGTHFESDDLRSLIFDSLVRSDVKCCDSNQAAVEIAALIKDI